MTATASPSSAPLAPPEAPSSPPRRAWILPIGLYLVLAGTGLTWGLPNTESWSNDDIAPISVLHVGEWYHNGSYKYPYLQLLVDRALYEPYLRSEQAGGRIKPDCEPIRRCFTDPIHQQGRLILISRLRSLAMGLGLVLLTAVVAGTAFGSGAAFWAALLAAVNETLTFFAKQGNLDVPYCLWFMASVWAYQRILGGSGAGAWPVFGALAGAALATKEGIVGAYPLMGLALVLGAARGTAAPATGGPPGPRPSAPWAPLALRTVLLLLSLLAVYGLAMNAIFNPQGLAEHLRHWLAGDGVDPYNDDFRGALWFAGEIVKAAAYGSGWPLLFLLLLGSLASLGARSTRRPGIVLLLPVLSYFAFTLLPIRFVFPRFMLPVYLLLSCLAAPALARGWRWAVDGPATRRLARGVLAASLLAFLAYSALYSLNVGLAMTADSRLAAETWLAAQLPEGAQVVGLGDKATLPRLELAHPDCEWVNWRRLPPYLDIADWKDSEREDDEVQALAEMMLTADQPPPSAPAGAPDWLVLSSRSMPSPGEPGAGLWPALVAGAAGYRLRWDSAVDLPARARHEDRPSPLGAWLPGLIVEARVSPRIWILERDP